MYGIRRPSLSHVTARLIVLRRLTLNVDKCGLDAGCKEGLEELLTPGGRPVTQLLVSNNDIGADGVAAIGAQSDSADACE
jgi:hypothetical protein